ncbi:MAG: hypothetical protein WC011_01590 [Candidatus Paceibacterota bacterium]
MRTSLFKSRVWPWFLILSGIGAFWLTACYFFMSAWVDGSREYGSNNSSMSPFLAIYYGFNSLLLLMSGMSLRVKYFREYSILSILLAISVTSSFFILVQPDQGIDFFNTLFGDTVYLGMFIGMLLGGIVLVPMFLISVYLSLFLGIQYFRGKIDETNTGVVLNPQINNENFTNLTQDTPNSQNADTFI